MARPRLYVIPGSHPSVTVRAMLEHKGIEYDRTDLMPVVSRLALRVLGFPGDRVPAMKSDGRRVQGSREIARYLDELRPEPPLFPSDPELRRAVEEAEAFGEAELQEVPRRTIWWAFRRDRSPMREFAAGARLGIPLGLAVRTGAPIVAAAARLNGSTDERVKADLAALPSMLDRVDGYVEQGVIGGAEPNAADFQIATSIRLLRAFDDLRPAIEGRPVDAVALRVIPDFPGRIGPVIPGTWLTGLHRS